LRFAITSPPSGCEWDFDPKAVIHARLTKKSPAFQRGGCGCARHAPPWRHSKTMFAARGRSRNGRGLKQAREGKGRIAAANATGRASPYRNRVAVLAVDGLTTGDADKRPLLVGSRNNLFLSFLTEKHRRSFHGQRILNVCLPPAANNAA
jgi:hypothetical protein